MMNSPLHIAALHGHYLIVKYLVEIDCTINLTNADGMTPL